MNPRYSAQDVLRCRLCDTPVPPLSCDLCHIYLCKACVGEHILDVSTEHKVVPIQKSLSGPVYPKCSEHGQKQCELYCKKCTIPVCILCASSDEHRGHEFLELLKRIESQKIDLQNDEQELESILSKYKEIESDIPSQKAYLRETSDNLKTIIDDHGKKLHTQVDAIIKKLKSEVDKKERKEFSILKDEEEKIRREISCIEKCILDQKELQASRDFDHVFGYKSRNQEFRNVLPKHNVTLPTFCASDITMDKLLAQFGSLTMKNDNTTEAITELIKGREDIISETFYHKSGKEFQCMYLDGMRFYLDDWGSKEWQPFPKRWYNEGLLITNSVVKDQENENRRRQQQQQQQSSGAGASGSRSQQPGYQQQSSSGQDDREGVLNHPKRGRIPTYIFQRKHNIHCFYDHNQGQWMRLPIGWELHHEMVGKLVDQVEEALPTWGDRQDILALLRQCNYDPDECMSTYLYLEGDPWLKAPKTHSEAKAAEEKDDPIENLRMQLKEVEESLKQERTARMDAEKLVKDQEEKITELEVENKQHEAQLMSLQQNRPKTAMQRPKTPQVVTQVVKEETVNPDDIVLLNNTAKELRKSQVHLKMEVQRYFDVLRGQISKAIDGMKNIKSTSSGSQEEMEEIRALYRKEAMQRKLLYNQLQELRGNIRVFCRARKDDRVGCCLKFPTDSDIVAMDGNQQKKMFSFDKVYDPNSTQEQIFADTKGIITSCVDGYNVCLMAYGQTGSGKTFTMMGPENNPGINIRAMKELFDVCKERVETVTYTLKVSLIEIYNETIQDLLTSDVRNLELRTAGNKVQIPNLKEVEIRNLDDIKKTMAQGDKNRTVASTKMNSTSSRSHLLLMLSVEGQDKVTGAITRGTLTLCDLAGSERISKTEAEGQRLVEAAAINKSLSALGQVFTSLRTSQLHVTPYRNSKLTQILQPSLGGDAKACLFVNVSPDVNNFSETVSTLNFGSNAKQIALGQAKQNIRKGP